MNNNLQSLQLQYRHLLYLDPVPNFRGQKSENLFSIIQSRNFRINRRRNEDYGKEVT